MRTAAATLAVAVLTVSIVFLPPLRLLDSLGVEVLHWLHARLLRHDEPAPPSKVSIVAFDEETFRRPPFKDIPHALWTPYLAPVVQSVLAGGADVVGLDVVFAMSGEQVRPGYDRPWLTALREGARDGRLVLGRVQHQQHPIEPTRAQRFVVGDDLNLRANNLVEDPDGIIRRMPFSFTLVAAGGTRSEQPALAVELAARSLKLQPVRAADGSLQLGDRSIPDAGRGSYLLRFDPRAEAVRVHSLADLAACAAAGRSDYFEQWFKDRIVLVGAVLDAEDRKLTSARFITRPEGVSPVPRCALPPMDGLYRDDLRRDSIPGVMIHATAIHDLLRGTPLRWSPLWIDVAALLGLALTGALLAALLPPMVATTALPLLWLGWAAIAVLGFEAGLVLPLLRGLLAPALAVPLATLWRHAVTERERRRIGQAFSLYLPRTVIDKLMQRGRLPELGGEQRECSVLFTDIAGFTSLAETATPQHVVETMNAYFGAVSDIIDRHGGFIDKFIGDAVMAVFGAPDEYPDHAERAVRAGLDIRALENVYGLDDHRRFVTRIGIHSGSVLIGNIGSSRRFNYTVLGDTVNAASRVEGVNKYYGSRLMATDATRRLCGDGIVFREIARVRVMNRAEPLVLHEPVGLAGSLDERERVQLAEFAAAMDAWRRGDFAVAHDGFARLAEDDVIARRYAARAALHRDFPPQGWDGVEDMEAK